MKDLKKLSKKELEDLGREHDIELDRRLTKAKLIEKLEEVITEEPTTLVDLKDEVVEEEAKKTSNVISKVPRNKITFIKYKKGSYLSVDGKNVAEIDNRKVAAGLAKRYGRAIKVADGVFIVKRG